MILCPVCLTLPFSPYYPRNPAFLQFSPHHPRNPAFLQCRCARLVMTAEHTTMWDGELRGETGIRVNREGMAWKVEHGPETDPTELSDEGRQDLMSQILGTAFAREVLGS